MAAYSRSDYTRAETNDETTNVPLLSDDLLDEGNLVGQPQDSRLIVANDVEDRQEVRFVVSKGLGRSGICFPFKITKTVVLLVIIVILMIICAVLSALLTRKSVTQRTDNVCVTEGCIDASHYIFHSIDFSVDPCDDFYQYACGGWMKKNPIPESKSFWAKYTVLQEQNDRLVRQKLIKTKNVTGAVKKAKAFYDACMDETTINTIGSKPLLKIIADLGGWNIASTTWNEAKFSLQEMLTAVQRNYSVAAFFSMGVDADDKNSSRNIIKVDQSGLTLPRTLYLSNLSNPKLMAYLKYMTTVGSLLGGQDSNFTREQMKEVLKFEMKLAKIFVPPENRSEIDEIYNKTTIRKLKKLCDKIPWLQFFKGQFEGITEITETEELVIYATRYLEALSPVINNASNTLLNNYLMWRVVAKHAPFLSKEFRDADEELTKVLTGAKKSEDLWKRCMGEADRAIGMALGALFIEEAFEGSSKELATDMVDRIRASFKKGFPDLTWMDDQTRKAAEDKADAVADKIGFPDYIKDPKELENKYAKLSFDVKKYFQNIIHSSNFHLLDNLNVLRKPVDKNKWFMIPSEVNAYYAPSFNQIVFPAGILQPPYFNKKFPKAINFGGIGAVVGHELSHAFDNSGRMYDKYGNFGVQWWTNRSVEQYKKRGECMVEHYSKFSYFGKKVNGKYTLGENIADNGGLKAAYYAYKEWESKNGVEPPLPLLQNMTSQQIFFLAFAQDWCANIRKEAAIVRLDEDSHSPNIFRVLGSLSNSDEFARDFKCAPGSKMNPPHKCHIW